MSDPAFQFKDLSDKAKAHAREKMMDHQLDFNWWEDVYKVVVSALATIGIEVGEKANRTAAGRIIYDPSIWFSGFSTQGDGCSFEGILRVASMKECLVKAKEHAPDDESFHGLKAESFHGLAARAEGIFEAVIVEKVRQRLLSTNEYPDCHETATFLISSGPRDHRTALNDGSDIPYELERIIDPWLEDVASWIYDLLENEHDHLTSDESLDAACEGYTFDEDGEIQ